MPLSKYSIFCIEIFDILDRVLKCFSIYILLPYKHAIQIVLLFIQAKTKYLTFYFYVCIKISIH